MKRSGIITILKPGKPKDDPKSYCPVALLGDTTTGSGAKNWTLCGDLGYSMQSHVIRLILGDKTSSSRMLDEKLPQYAQN